MTLIKSINKISPKFGKKCWLAENATIVGNVTMGNECSVWYNAVVRGDVNKVTIGNRVNIQDGAIIHNTYKKTECHIGDNSSIAHSAVVHGCTIEENVLIGIGAIILDNAYIEKNSIVAAGAVVMEGTRIESGSIYGGCPAKCIKKIDPEQFKEMNERIANNYPKYADWNKNCT
jgi:carbonic anhydrase/acetyltransferase-like protein (isoleucine patch superfamily)